MFIKFTHLEKLGKVDTEGILDNDNVSVTAKIDGTNASIWYDGKIRCGSRTRELTEEKDNAGFWQWVNGDNEEAKRLRDFCKDHENLHVFGEWMGNSKFVGSIKSYNPNALGHMFIFDVYDYDDERYLGDEEWRPLLAAYDLDKWFVKLFGIFNHPTMDDIMKIVDENKFLLNNSSIVGEGVCIKVPGWKNCYGHECYGKIVREDYRIDKAKKKETIAPGDVERAIVENYLTDSELAKNMAKTCVWADVDDFDRKNGKMIGFFLNLCFNESILQEVGDWVKKYKNPTVDFAALRNLSNVKARVYLGF